MRRIWLIPALSLLIAGFYEPAEPSSSGGNYVEFYDYVIKNIAPSMKHAGFTVVQKNLEVIGATGQAMNMLALFRVESYPDALKKYFGELRYRFFAVENNDASDAFLYLQIRPYLEEYPEGPVNPQHTYFYTLVWAKKDFHDWQKKIIGSENVLADMKNKIVRGLLNQECVSRSELLPQNGKIKNLPAGAGSYSTVLQKKFSPKVDAFLTLLFKEMAMSYDLRFVASEHYPFVQLDVVEFPKGLESVLRPMRNKVVLEDVSKDGKELFKIANKSRTEKETGFFTVELSQSEDLAGLARSTAREIFNGFYFAYCVVYGI